MRLGFGFYESSTTGTMILDAAPIAVGTVIETGEHGYGYLSTFLPMSTDEAFWFYNLALAKYVKVSAGATSVYEGRVEDRRIVNGGIEIGCLGYWRAFYDAPYTALWSTESYREWQVMNEEIDANRTPAKYVLDNNERLYISLKKNETYASTGENVSWYFRIPHLSEKTIAVVSGDYEMLLPGSFQLNVRSADDDDSNNILEATIQTGDGTNQSDSFSQAITAGKELIEIQVRNATGDSWGPNGQESDYRFAKVTNLRVKTTATAEVNASEIAAELVTYINGINSSQISSSTALIDNPGVDLKEISYHDEWPGRILVDLAERGDDSTPAKRYEVGVWEDQQLHFRERGSAGVDWYTDLQSLSIDSTLDTMRNSVYATYRNEAGRDRRTATSTDTTSITQYGITRRAAVWANTQDSAQAGVYRNVYLEDNKDITPRSQLIISSVYDKTGAQYPLYMVRSGDSITIRNLPPTAGSGVDKIRSFRISATSYSVDTNILEVTPELDMPGIVGILSHTLAATQDGPALPPGRQTGPALPFNG